MSRALSVPAGAGLRQLVRFIAPSLQMKRFFSVLIPQGPDPIGIVAGVFEVHHNDYRNSQVTRKSRTTSRHC